MFPVTVTSNFCSPCPTSSTAGFGIHTKKLSNRPFDSVAGEFLGLTSSGEIMVGHEDGEIALNVLDSLSLKRGALALGSDQITVGESVLAVGDIVEGPLNAKSIAVGTRSIRGHIATVASWGIGVDSFYGSDGLAVTLDDHTQVVNRDGDVRTWHPSTVTTGMPIYGTGYVRSDSSVVADRVWMYE